MEVEKDLILEEEESKAVLENEIQMHKSKANDLDYQMITRRQAAGIIR